MKKYPTIIALFFLGLITSASTVRASGVQFVFDTESGQTLPTGMLASLQAAGNIWSSYLTPSFSGETIHVLIDYTSMGGTATSAQLSSTGPTSFDANFDSGTSNSKYIANTYYPYALADHIAGTDSLTSQPTDQITMEINSDIGAASSGVLTGYSFYYGTNDQPGANTFNFEAIALHELMHGLGMVSYLQSNGSYNDSQSYPTVYDHYLYDKTANAMLMNETQTARAASEIDGAIYFDGPDTLKDYGAMAPIYAPATFALGSSLMHVDPSVTDLMNPTQNLASTNLTPSALDLGILSDIGWTVVVPEPMCLSLIGVVMLLGYRRRAM